MSWRRSNREVGEGGGRGGWVGWGGVNITGCRLADIKSLKHISQLMGTDKRSNEKKKLRGEWKQDAIDFFLPPSRRAGSLSDLMEI